MDRFFEWAERRRIQFKALELAEFPGMGYGLRLTRDVRPGELVFRSREVFSVNCVLGSSPLGRRIAQVRERDRTVIDDWMTIALGILWEKRAAADAAGDTHWAPYFDAIPQRVEVASEWPDEVLRLTRGSELPRMAEGRRDLSRSEYSLARELVLSPVFPEADIPSEEDYRAAYSLVSSRAFGSPTIFTGGVPAMIPMFDLGNYIPGTKNVLGFGSQEAELHAGEAIAAGDQLLVNYGAKGNAELALDFGYCVPENPFDYVPLVVRGPSGEEAQVDLTAKGPDGKALGKVEKALGLSSRRRAAAAALEAAEARLASYMSPDELAAGVAAFASANPERAHVAEAARVLVEGERAVLESAMAQLRRRAK